LKKIAFVILVCFAVFFTTGCQEEEVSTVNNTVKSGLCEYEPSGIHVIGLTSIERNPQKNNSSLISIYVSLMDSFDCSIKSPGSFRFELYEYVPRSSQPKGKRLIVWPDIDLADKEENNRYWNDLIRAYNFKLNANINPNAPKNYALQATCMTGGGKRVSEIFILNSKK